MSEERPPLPAGEILPGNTDLAIGTERGQVVVRFPKAVREISFDPVNAANVGKHLIDLAVLCGAQVQIKQPAKRVISREERERMITRAMNIYANLTVRNFHPRKRATEVIDSILSMID